MVDNLRLTSDRSPICPSLGYLRERERANKYLLDCTEQSGVSLCQTVIIISRTGSSTDVVFCLSVYIAVRKPTNLN